MNNISIFHKVQIYRVPQCMSPRPNWDSPTPSPPSVVCSPPPEPKGGTLACGWGGGGVPIRTTGEKPNTLSILLGIFFKMLHSQILCRCRHTWRCITRGSLSDNVYVIAAGCHPPTPPWHRCVPSVFVSVYDRTKGGGAGPKHHVSYSVFNNIRLWGEGEGGGVTALVIGLTHAN